MTTILRVTAALLFWLAIAAPTKVQAQAAGSAFSCDGTFYQIRQVGTGGTAFSALYVVNRATATYTTSVYTFGGTNATGNLGTVLNALGYNSQDGYMYAVTYPADNGAPNASTGIHLFRIGQGGIQDLGITNLPLAQYNSGTFDKSGNYYLTTRNSTDATYRNTLFRLNVANFATVLTTHDQLPLVNSGGTPANDNFSDIGYNPSNNTLYSVARLGDVSRIVIGATNAVVTPLSSGSASTEIFGSSFFDISGNMYAYSNGTVGTANSAGFYSVDIQTGAATLISTIDAANNSDGASCINPDQRIDVVKELVSVVPTGTLRQFDVRFNIRVKNTGTSTATNVQVSDFLRGNAVNTTFPTATTVTLVAGASVTNYAATAGVAPTLAFNANFNGQTTNTDLLSGTQALTANQSALIDFTVRVTFPNPIPTVVQNNYAYASTISGTAANQGHVQLANGDILPPGNLLAEDQSTNSAAFPTTANGDTPSPTPVRFTTAIQGTVFEDVNYGGGVGRNQATGNGQGMAGARVELYSTTGTFLNATITDANGDYIFTTTTGTTSLVANTSYQIRVVNSSVRSTRPGSINGLLPVQTFRTDATTATLAEVTDRVGGEQADEADYGDRTSALPLSAASGAEEIQSLTRVLTPASGPRTSIDFGFNFSTVVNTNNTGQGCLRQFITNSNALTNENLAQTSSLAGSTLAAGTEYAVFMLSDGRTTGAAAPGIRLGTPAAAGFASGTFTFNVTGSTLPTITDSNTAIDGKLQSRLTGETATATAGTSTGPEITLNFGANPPTTVGFGGLLVTGANTRIASLSLTNAQGTSLNSAGGFDGDGGGVSFTGTGVTGSVVTDITATGNAIASVLLRNGANGVTVSNSVLRAGRATAASGTLNVNDGAGIVLTNASGNTITGNTISGNAGYGIEFIAANGAVNDSNSITGNTISGNGASTQQTRDAGISIARGDNNLIQANTITGNSGDGILAMTGTSGNRFSQNNTSGNNGSVATGNLGIDLSANAATNGDGVSLNADNKTAASGANGLLNFPVFTQATVSGTNLLVTGYARSGAVIEFFIASTDQTNFGEGATFLATRTENASDDSDRRIGTYSGVVGNMGLNQGSETNTSRFAFSIPVSPAQITSLAANRLTATATVPTTVNSLAVGNTSEFSGVINVINGAPLPVELTTFEAKAIGQSVFLTWTTASEKDNDHFVVERAFSDQSFAAIATVEGAGSSMKAHSYSFTDAGVGTKNQGTIYYRLQQVDTDGTINQGPVRTVLFSGEKMVAVTMYPNPTTKDTELDLTALPTGSYKVSVVDMMGRTLHTETLAGGALHPFAARDLTSGAYLVVIRGNNVKITQRLVKK